MSIPCSTRRRRLSGILLAAFGIAYPFVVYWGMETVSPVVFVVLAVAIVAIRLLWTRGQGEHSFSLALLAVGGGLLALLGYDGLVAAKSYPVLMSLAFATAFGASLAFPPSLVERLAALAGQAADAPARVYMRRVTVVWTAFLLANAAVSCWTALAASEAVWAFYNGFLSYVLMGLLAGGELLTRRRVRRRRCEG